MKYYGDVNKNRLEVIYSYRYDDFKDPTDPIGYLNEKGMFFEYVMNRYGTEGPEVDTNRITEISTLRIEYLDCSKIRKKRYKGETYYIGVETYGKNYQIVHVWRLLPRIENDEVFKWKDNQKYGTKETIVIQNNFEFNCIVKANGDAIIDVRYTKCDNKHRNKVTISRIEVYNASNEELLNAIDEWTEMFTTEMTEANSSITKFKKTTRKTA